MPNPLPWFIEDEPSKISEVTLSDCDLALLKTCVSYTKAWSRMAEDPIVNKKLTQLLGKLIFDDEIDI